MIHSKLVYDDELEEKLVILYEQGSFSKPLLVLNSYQAKRLCNIILDQLEGKEDAQIK